MADNKLDSELRESMKNIWGYNEEQMKNIEKNTKQREILESFPVFISKKMVATCIKAENCGMNEVGDRYVFTASGSMIKDETCERPCLWAMSEFLPFSYMGYDRISSGLDPNDMHLDHVSCPDSGCNNGGFGSSIFKITFED
jgi:uncharacterized repeat protein (TIGR04076 family)